MGVLAFTTCFLMHQHWRQNVLTKACIAVYNVVAIDKENGVNVEN